ncbi:MAG: MG2 domain-containing protein, partial [Capsulimonas sp.]|uniref:alpha-2-macroglobulin family protein n=1 Tax=Capsulimonas sp. TaxID=2494211 RepID=UPI003263D2F1
KRGLLAAKPRLGAAAALLALGGLFVAMINAGPHTGTVQGRCLEQVTGAAVPKARVWLEKEEDASGESSSEEERDEVVVSATGDRDAPYGWGQGAAADDAAGQSDADVDLSTHADSDGNFTLAHIPAGRYTLHASGTGTEDGETSVVVTDEDVARVSIELPLAASEVSFSDTISTWTPAEDITPGLRGQLRDHNVTLSLDRVDLPSVLSRRPRMLAGPRAEDLEPANLWLGEFTRVRQWSQEVGKRKHGYFYEELHLGKLPPGMYRLTVGNNEAKGVNWIVSTQIAMIRKSYHGKALAYVSDIETGTPTANTTVTLYEDQGLKPPVMRDQETTDPDGVCRLSGVGATAESRGIMVARNGDSIAPITMELNSPGESGEQPGGESASTAYSGGALRSFVYTERPVYRPGQAVYFKGIARWFGALQGAGGAPAPDAEFRLPKNQTVRVDIHDAQDTLIAHQELQTNDLGSWNGKIDLGDEALTGEYSVRAEMGDQTAATTFLVAAYRKPEYRVKITFDKTRYVRGDTIDATVTATYYHGAPVTSGSVRYYVMKTEGASGKESFQSYRRPDDSDDSGGYGEGSIDGTARLDDHGQAHIRVPTQVGGVDEGDQSYDFSATVSDPSDKTVSADESVVVGQGEFSLTLTPSLYACAPSTPVTVTLSARGPSDVPIAGQALDVKTYYESWVNGKRRIKGERKSLLTTDAQGDASLPLSPDQPGLLVTRVETQDKRGNAISAETSVWVAGEGEDVSAQYPDMGVILDRTKYKIGDTARVLINTQNPGPTALVTVEGATLYQSWIIPLRRRSTSLEIPVSALYAPGVTVSVCCLQDKQLLSGSADLTIEDQRRALHVKVTGDRALYHPGDPATLTVQTTDDAGQPQPGEVSVGVVDSSIYAISEENPQTILEALQPAQGNAVNTDYSCAPLYLGDVDKGAMGNVKLRSKFPDTAYWAPDVRTDASGMATVQFTFPDNLTTWRVTCIGHTAETAVGKGTCDLVVSKDLLVRLEAPPFLIAGDRSTVLGVVNNNTASPAQTQVTLNASGLQMGAPLTQTITVPAHGAARAEWPVTASNLGPVTFKLTAVSQNLNDGVQETLTVQPHAAQEATWQSGSIVRQVSKTVTLDPKALPDSTMLRVRLAPTVSGALLTASDYIAAYPYGSAEDTASILVGDAVLLQASSGDAPAFPMSAKRRADLTRGARRALLRLYRFQKDDGAWGWWETSTPDLNTTSYALWSMQLAQRAGIDVKPSALEAAVKATEQLASDFRAAPRDSAFLQSPSGLAFAALTLANAGITKEAQADIKTLQKRWRLRPETKTYADLSVVAMAMHQLGNRTEAAVAINELWSGRMRLGQLTAWTYKPHPNSAGADQNPPDALTTVWAMMAAQTITPTDPRLDAVARCLMANRTGDHWDCPKTTAEAIGALTAYLGQAHEMQPAFDATILVNGAPLSPMRFDRASVEQPDRVIEIPATQLRAGDNDITLTKNGPGRLYYSLELRQQIAQASPRPEPGFWHRVNDRLFHPERALLPPADSGYRIKRVLLRTTTRRNFLWEDTVPARETNYRREDTMLVRLIIDSTRAGSHLIVEEPIPAGCTISEVSGDQAESWDNWWDYTDVRDNRIVFFIGDLPRGRHEIDYRLRASSPGRYDVMPTSITGTFDPTLRALGNSSRIEVGE